MGIINAQLNVITAKSRFQPGSYVWFGQPKQIPDPDNPATLKIPYLDADLTQPASAIQGLDSDSKFQQTITGFLYGSGMYSIRVMTAADNTGTQLYYIPEVAVTATVNELGTAAYADIATTAQALAGTADVLPDAEQVHLAIRGLAVGTVSQSGGVPTGAIIERGSNVNGEYVKFADGTMICWRNILSTLNQGTPVGSSYITSTDLVWAYPASFSGFVSVTAAAGRGGNDFGYWGYVSYKSITTTEFTHRVVTLETSSSVGILRTMTAAGLWY